MFKTGKIEQNIEYQLLNEFQIKGILIALMFLDHLRHIDGLLPENWLLLFNILSRGVAPAFAYFAVEGIKHTRNLKNYNLRLILGAFIMECGNRLLNYFFLNNVGSVTAEVKKWLFITDNILWTLSLCVFGISLTIWCKNLSKSKKVFIYLISAACFICSFFFCEWGVVLTLFMAVVYYFRNNKKIRYISYIIIEIIAFFFRSETLYFLVFPLIWIYNRKRGSTKKSAKYFFYLFYPIHLWAIYLVNYYANFK